MVAWWAASVARKCSQPGGYDGDGDHADWPNGIWSDDGGVCTYCDADDESLFAFTNSGQNGADCAQSDDAQRLVRRLPVANADTASASDEYTDAPSATNGYTDAPSDGDGYTDATTDGDGYANANRDGYADTATDANRYANADTNRDGYADTDADRGCVTDTDRQFDRHFSLARWYAGHRPFGDGDNGQK